MKIAKIKKSTNIAEYVLYMWQLEDLIRSFNFDISKLEKQIYGVFSEKEEERAEIQDWYNNIVLMMQMENVQKTGHLQVTTNVILDLNTLHVELLKNQKEQEYRELYYKAAPNLREFEKHITDEHTNEVEMMFIGLYGLLMMRMSKKTVTADTENAMQTFSTLMAALVQKYHKREEEEAKFQE